MQKMYSSKLHIQNVEADGGKLSFFLYISAAVRN